MRHRSSRSPRLEASTTCFTQRLPVVIPDAVFYEATNASGKLGAQEILDWYRSHMGAVRVEPTEAFQNATALLAAQGGRLPRDLGERAAVELIRNYPLSDNERALLLSDDRDLDRVVVVDPQKLILLTTWDYLRQLEEARRIQSAAAVFEAVREAGRHPSIRDMWSRHDPETRDAVRAVIERANREPGPKR